MTIYGKLLTEIAALTFCEYSWHSSRNNLADNEFYYDDTTYMHTCLFVSVCVHVRLFVYMHVCMYFCMYILTHACTSVCMYAGMCMYACMYACSYVRTYVRSYVCMYVCILISDGLWVPPFEVCFGTVPAAWNERAGKLVAGDVAPVGR